MIAPSDLTLYKLYTVIYKPADGGVSKTWGHSIFFGPGNHTFGCVYVGHTGSCSSCCKGSTSCVGEKTVSYTHLQTIWIKSLVEDPAGSYTGWDFRDDPADRSLRRGEDDHGPYRNQLPVGRCIKPGCKMCIRDRSCTDPRKRQEASHTLRKMCDRRDASGLDGAGDEIWPGWVCTKIECYFKRTWYVVNAIIFYIIAQDF